MANSTLNSQVDNMNNAVLVNAMQVAISLAQRARFMVAPNPCVGAVLLLDGEVVAGGYHAEYGKDHAEVACLNDAKAKNIDLEKCTLVVTLEPCNHYGKTPPCTKAILEAGIKHVVIGALDPNDTAAGGAQTLREAGVKVETGICEQECLDLIADFISWQKHKRAYLILKLASTLDGHIATRTGHSQWVSGEKSRAKVHDLRAKIALRGGVVLIGGSTLYEDNPLLTARTDYEVETQPHAAVLTSRLQNINNTRLMQERASETFLFTTAAGAANPAVVELRKNGLKAYGVDKWTAQTGADLDYVLRELYENGMHYVLCEGGGKLGLSLLKAGLVGEFHLHQAPKILGDCEAKPLFHGLEPFTMDDAVSMRIVKHELCGEDIHILLRTQLKQ